MEPIKILIADDDSGMRTVMRKLVERAEGYRLVGEAEDGNELLDLYDQTLPDVVLMLLQILVGAAVYVLLSILTKNHNFFYLLEILKRMLRKE